MLRLVPFVLAAAVIVALTVVQGSMTERWTDNLEAAYCATLLSEVPMKVGDWEGQDQEVDDQTIEVAGAEGFVSRVYYNPKLNQNVRLWLIVGHARDTSIHEPDQCYVMRGGTKCQDKTQFVQDIDESKVQFWTSVFSQDVENLTLYDRVFWTWFKPAKENEAVDWIAPENPRFYFGSTKALYKMYFTTSDPDDAQAADESICLKFAKEFIPALNPKLAKANQGPPEGFVDDGKAG